VNLEPFRRNHHYVPSLYLRGFTGDDQQVSVYRLLVAHPNAPQWKRQSLRGIAYYSHLYTRVTAEGETDEVEKWLEHDFETPASIPLRKAISDEKLTPQDWYHIKRFVAAQDLRTPARLLENLKRWEKTVPSLLEEVSKKAVDEWQAARARGERLESPDSVDPDRYIPIQVSKQRSPGEKMGSLQTHVLVGRAYWLYSLKHLLTRTVNSLLDSHWTILHAPEDVPWFTSDDPVIRLNYYAAGRYDFKGGWGNRGTEILLPISPRHLLFTKIGERPPRRGTRVTVEPARQLRRFMAEHAHRMIIAAAPDCEVQEMRVRTVSSEQHRSEREQWQNWHEQQTTAERQLRGW